MNLSDLGRNAYMLKASLAKRGYMRWWHSFTGKEESSGKERTFFIEYFLINPGLGGDTPIFGQHPHYKKKGMKPSYCMIKAGAYPTGEEEGVELHAYFPANALHVAQKPFHLQIEENECSEDRIRGYVDVTDQDASYPFLMTDSGVMEWNLELNKSIACHTGPIAGRLSSFFNALDTFWHAEGIQTQYRGTVTLNGVSYRVDVESSYGYADKHWGRNYNYPWLQLSSCHLFSRKTGRELKYSALAVEGCCPRFLCFSLKPKLMLQLTYTGEDYCFSFARPFSLSRVRWKKKESGKRFIWHIKGQNRDSYVKLSASCLKQDMMPLRYENPLGLRRKAPLWSGGNGTGCIELYRITPQGSEWLDTLELRHVLCDYQLHNKS